MATYRWGGRPVSCGAQGWGGAGGGVAQGPVGAQSGCLTQPGRWERAGAGGGDLEKEEAGLESH